MAKYIATETMNAYNIGKGNPIDMSHFNFKQGDTITIYDRNGVKWYEVKMFSDEQGTISKVFSIGRKDEDAK